MQCILIKNTSISFQKYIIVHENPFVSILGRKKEEISNIFDSYMNFKQ